MLFFNNVTCLVDNRTRLSFNYKPFFLFGWKDSDNFDTCTGDLLGCLSTNTFKRYRTSFCFHSLASKTLMQFMEGCGHVVL